MTDLSDVNMEGVKPQGDAPELPFGTFLVRIEDTEKKATKDRFDEAGNKLPNNHYLQITQKVYGGPNSGQIEFARLNLWNTNQQAVDIAKSELKSIQDATGVFATNSEHFHGKWMVLEIKPGKQDPTKRFKHYASVPAGMLDAFKDVPLVPAKNPNAASAPAPAAQSTAAPAVPHKDALPSWAAKKTA